MTLKNLNLLSVFQLINVMVHDIAHWIKFLRIFSFDLQVRSHHDNSADWLVSIWNHFVHFLKFDWGFPIMAVQPRPMPACWQREIRQCLFGIRRGLPGLKFNPSWLEKKIDPSAKGSSGERGGMAWLHVRFRQFIAYWASSPDVLSRQLQNLLPISKRALFL